MSKLFEKTVSSERAYDGRFLKVQRERVICPDGKERQREFILHPGAALVVPVTADGQFVMERQYRHSLRKVFLEFPAGKLDPGEDPLAAAKRELLEETGYEAQDWKHLGLIHPAIGYSNEFIEIYLATGLAHKGARPDPGEELEVVLMDPGEVLELARRGELTDVKTLSALFHYGLNGR